MRKWPPGLTSFTSHPSTSPLFSSDEARAAWGSQFSFSYDGEGMTSPSLPIKRTEGRISPLPVQEKKTGFGHELS